MATRIYFGFLNDLFFVRNDQLRNHAKIIGKINFKKREKDY